MSWDDGYHKQCRTCGDYYDADSRCKQCQAIEYHYPSIMRWVEKVVAHQVELATQQHRFEGHNGQEPNVVAE